MTTKATIENKETYQRTISKNQAELKSINTKHKFFLFIFYAYFMSRYKSLMSELANE